MGGEDAGDRRRRGGSDPDLPPEAVVSGSDRIGGRTGGEGSGSDRSRQNEDGEEEEERERLGCEGGTDAYWAGLSS